MLTIDGYVIGVGSRCKHCQSWKPKTEFEVENGSLYKFCKECMKEQGRSVEYPPMEERGFGKII